MCKHPYAASWPNTAAHCPNLVPTDADRRLFSDPKKKHLYVHPDAKSFNVTVAYPGNATTWPSLAHFWSDWYRQYKEAVKEYPRLMIRFEDLLFHPKEVINAVCRCAGAKVPKSDDGRFVYVVDEGKWGAAHQGSSNMVTAMIKYGNSHHRFNNMTKADLSFARTAIDADLMTLFRYQRELDQ
jgi:hypothetical protein